MYKAKILENELLTPITKKMTKSFREYYDEKILIESPASIGRDFGTLLDNKAVNKEEAEEFIQFKEPIETLSKVFFGEDITIYDDFENNIHYCYFISMKHRLINGFVYFKLNQNRMETCGLWNNRESKGLVRQMIIKYFLPKYGMIISDSATTTQGQEFWKKIMKYGIDNNIEVGILYFSENKKQPIKNIEDINNAWQGLDLDNKRLYIRMEHHE